MFHFFLQQTLRGAAYLSELQQSPVPFLIKLSAFPFINVTLELEVGYEYCESTSSGNLWLKKIWGKAEMLETAVHEASARGWFWN